MKVKYSVAEDMAAGLLNDVDNITKWCAAHNLSYYTVLKIKNRKNKKEYPLIVSKILTIFGKNITILKIKQY